MTFFTLIKNINILHLKKKKKKGHLHVKTVTNYYRLHVHLYGFTMFKHIIRNNNKHTYFIYFACKQFS